MTAHRWRGRVGLAFGLYAVLLGASTIVRDRHPRAGRVDPRERVTEVQAVNRGQVTRSHVRLAYWDLASAPPQGGETIVLLHGSPGHKEDFRRLGPMLASDARVLVPDLPGFGSSTNSVPDYSFLAHAIYVRQLLDVVGVRRAHVVGFSMGGGVALSLAGQAPERVASLTLLSAIGVQEMELTGDYYANHLVHGAQLAALWGLLEATPHMGFFDGGMLGLPYARNFYDSDQRPLRGILSGITVPTLIVHGTDDSLVPFEAAQEHHRLVPQSQLASFEGDHFLLFARMKDVGEVIEPFIRSVAAGRAQVRANAEPDRTRAAALDYRMTSLPKLRGLAALVSTGLLVVASALAENVTSLVGGLLVARGRMGLTAAFAGCALGMFLGNVVAYLAGRVGGLRLMGIMPLTWLVRSEPLERRISSLSESGLLRVIQGAAAFRGHRFDSLAAGCARIRAPRFIATTVFIAAVRTVLLVGLAAVVGRIVWPFMPASMPPYAGSVATVVIVASVLKAGFLAVTAWWRPW